MKKDLPHAKYLKQRIAALETSDCLGGLAANDPLGGWHELSGDRGGQWAGRVSPNWRIIVRPSGDAAEVLLCTSVEVNKIEDYHKGGG